MQQRSDSVSEIPVSTGCRCGNRASYHSNMARTDLYLKITIEHDPDEKPERLAKEICRMARKTYGVRDAELTSFVTRAEETASS